jgi:hypothetical protein
MENIFFWFLKRKLIKKPIPLQLIEQAKLKDDCFIGGLKI